MANNLKAERTLTAEGKISDSDWLDEAARYFEKRPTGGEDMAFWANVTNAERCRSIAKSLRSQSLSTQQPIGEVRVKALEWLPEKYGDHVLGWRSVSSVIRYFVEDMGSGCGEWRYWLQRGDHVIAKCASEEEAKAAAQSNCDTTILSALHPNQESGE